MFVGRRGRRRKQLLRNYLAYDRACRRMCVRLCERGAASGLQSNMPHIANIIALSLPTRTRLLRSPTAAPYGRPSPSHRVCREGGYSSTQRTRLSPLSRGAAAGLPSCWGPYLLCLALDVLPSSGCCCGGVGRGDTCKCRTMFGGGRAGARGFELRRGLVFR